MKEKEYIFSELHFMGGHATVTMTESQILKYMRETKGLHPKYKDATDAELLDEFCVVNWAMEKKIDNI